MNKVIVFAVSAVLLSLPVYQSVGAYDVSAGFFGGLMGEDESGSSTQQNAGSSLAQEKESKLSDEQLAQRMVQHARRGSNPLKYVFLLFLLLTMAGLSGMAYMLFAKQKE